LLAPGGDSACALSVRDPLVPAKTECMPDIDRVRTDRWSVYEHHAGAIRRYVARRVEPDAVEDVVAEVFAIAWRKRPREDDPLPWLYAVAAKTIHTHRRSYARRTRLLTRLGDRHRPDDAADPAELVVGDPQLAHAFETLKPRDREAICLVAWEGLSIAEAADATGCSAATFAVRFSRARTRLAAALEPAADQQPLLSTNPVPGPNGSPADARRSA
jgi:RNA polymerase sigma-70 factor (ECF subfamily)